MCIRRTWLLLFLFLFYTSNLLYAREGTLRDKHLVRQLVQLSLSSAKTIALLWADTVDLADLDKKKQAVFIKAFARIAYATTKALDIPYVRDSISKGAHINVALWQIVKDCEEWRILNQLQREYGYFLKPSCIKKYYKNNMRSCELDEESFDQKVSWQKVVKPLFRLIEWGATVGLISGAGNYNFWLVMQSISDLLLRFWCNDDDFISPTWIGKVEGASVGVAAGWDMSRAVCSVLLAKKQKKPAWDDMCPVCKNAYGRLAESPSVLIYRMSDCGHWCCASCASKYKEHMENRMTCPICKRAEQMPELGSVKNPGYRDIDVDEKVCAICYDPEHDLVELECGHEICDVCFGKLPKQIIFVAQDSNKLKHKHKKPSKSAKNLVVTCPFCKGKSPIQK